MMLRLDGVWIDKTQKEGTSNLRVAAIVTSDVVGSNGWPTWFIVRSNEGNQAVPRMMMVACLPGAKSRVPASWFVLLLGKQAVSSLPIVVDFLFRRVLISRLPCETGNYFAPLPLRPPPLTGLNDPVRTSPRTRAGASPASRASTPTPPASTIPKPLRPSRLRCRRQA